MWLFRLSEIYFLPLVDLASSPNKDYLLTQHVVTNMVTAHYKSIRLIVHTDQFPLLVTALFVLPHASLFSLPADQR